MVMDTIELKAFVPAKDFELCRQFYEDLGFEAVWSTEDLAHLRAGHASFLLQRFYRREHAENFAMHLLVPDVEAWWRHVVDQRLEERYRVRVAPPEDRPWGVRDFVLCDPSGVLWRIGKVIEPLA